MVPNINGQDSINEKDSYTFVKEEGRWYIYLDNYLGQGWSKQNLELMEGAHQVLNLIANGAKRLHLRLSLKPFEGANLLQLIEHCAAPKGDGIYIFNPQKTLC